MKKAIHLVIVLALAAAVSPLQGQTPRPGDLRQLMIDKLKFAQRILEGLALNDYDKIGQSADRLIQISKSAEWLVHKTPRYEVSSNEFRRAAEEVARKAREKNLDGVALAYVDLTRSCVRCHQYVREVRDARLPDLRPDLAAAASDAGHGREISPGGAR